MELENLIKERLNRFADKLIDLSRRNKMINSNFQSRSKTHFRIIDEIPDLLYEKLLKNEMEFIPLPPLDSEPTDENTPEFEKEVFIAKNIDQEYIKNIQAIEQTQKDNLNEDQEQALRQLKDRVRIKLNMLPRSTKDTPIEDHCKNNGLNPNFDLPTPDKNSKDNPKWNDKKIQTLMLPENLNKYMDSIYKKYNSFIKETGVNSLFFCFGFLEWTESKQSDRKIYSPILTFQAVLNQKNKKLLVGGAEDELNTNQALNEKLKRDFSIELPEFKERENHENNFLINTYLEEAKKKVTENHNWKVKNWVSFGLYSTQNMVIAKDIRHISGSEKRRGALEKILLGKTSGENESEKYNIDDIKHQKQIPALIESADASQHKAILDVLKGKNLVIKGPPGTGKSQTIVNIISSLISQGKKVLFVAQKQAALDVVKNKLQAKGLGNYILEVFSIKANKKSVIESIKRRLDMDPLSERPNAFEIKSKKLYQIKEKLNNYSALMSKNFKNTGWTIHDIIWRYKPSDVFQFFKIENIEELSKDTIDNHITSLNSINDIYLRNSVKSLKENPFHKIKKLPFGYDSFNDFKNKIDSLYDKIKKISEEEKEILNLNKNLADVSESLFDHPLIKKWFNSNKEKNQENYLKILKIIFLTDSEKIKQIFKTKKEYDRLVKENKLYREKMKCFKLHDPPNLSLIKEASETLKRETIFFFLSSKYWKAKKLLKDVYSGKRNWKPASLLNNYYIYLKNLPYNKKREQELKNDTDKFFNEITKKTDIQNPSILIKEDYQDILLMIANSKTLDREFKLSWLKEPNSLNLYKGLIQKQNRLKDEFQEMLGKPDIEIKFEYFSFKNIAKFFEGIKNNELNLDKYRQILNITNNIPEQLKCFYEDFIKSGRDIKFIDKDYDYSIKKSHKDILETVYYDHLDFQLQNFREDLKTQDESIMSIYRQIVSKNCSELEKNAPEGNSIGRVQDRTEMSLIYHINSLNNPRISLRDYFNRAYNSIISLKPCSLMSPLSVSQVLPQDIKYDTLIIDEASQMKPEYSIASIARANQIVIVGDQKQLPPTNFFQTNIEEEEEEKDETGESILDMALTALQFPRDLRWHYRSKHENLIKFSNEKFYDGRLIIPVAPDTHNQKRGVKNILIEGGIYRSRSSLSRGGGFNEIEAKKVVDEVIKFMKERPDESLGVVAINKPQKELIEHQFDIEKNEKSHVEKYLNLWSQKDDGLNEFFIKNLENVQGDERDVIFISTVYGPDETSKKVSQRFGPISGEYGHRRLNVLFTRSKNQLVLFTSLKSSDIQVSEKSSEGVKILKEYLSYSEKGNLPTTGEANSREIESPFQQWAVDYINSFSGFSADWEIGVKGYRIDIGVKHKDYHHGYIMAVETDGANYHSIKSARDRDKLRQEILESYGWKFHRIWSTDWLQDPIEVKEKLKKALEDRVKELNLV